MNAPLNPIHESDQTPGPKRQITLALAGNPNCGKTTLFNALTGMRQKVANYPGITVEKKTGQTALTDGTTAEVLDLPGTYSLIATSPDEQVTAGILNGTWPGTPAPDRVIAVVDASTLARGLFLVSQLLSLGRPLVVALTMSDIAKRRGTVIDHEALSAALGVPVVPVVASQRTGLLALRAAITEAVAVPVPAALLDQLAHTSTAPDALLAESAGRYKWVDSVLAATVTHGTDIHLSRKVDAFLLHPVFGLMFFVVVMAGMFVSLFTLAAPLMDACQSGVNALGALLTARMAEGDLKSLITDGVFSGVGSVVVFVPQIAVLFLFLAILEDSGYLARAAFLMDRLLRSVGLHGKSFIPLLSSFACAIPGIMATRTINSRRERLVTILVAPFMSCSARLPVYALLIAAVFSQLAGWQQGLIMLGLYLLGIIAAATVAWVTTRFSDRLGTAPFILEMPSYKLPQARHIARQVWHNALTFLTKAGTTIFALSIVIWALTTYPKPSATESAATSAAFSASWQTPTDLDQVAAEKAFVTARDQHLASAALAGSFAGRIGHAIEPVIAPLGFDWKMGIGLVGAFAAREVFVSTLGIVYAVGDSTEETAGLQVAMHADRRADGSPVWTTAVATSMLVWFVLAMQCISTTVVVRRETGGWTWPLAQLVGMNVLAWIVCFAIYRVMS